MRCMLALMVLVACGKPADKAKSDRPAAGAVAVVTASGCDKIPVADFQALITDKITKVTGAPIGACNAYVGGELGIAVVMNPGPDFDPANGHALTGIGDKAYWHEGDAGISGPKLHALKGTNHCEINTPAAPHTTMKGDAEAYMKLAGTLCNDMFAAQ